MNERGRRMHIREAQREDAERYVRSSQRLNQKHRLCSWNPENEALRLNSNDQ